MPPMTLTPGLAIDIDETLSWTTGHWIEGLQVRFGNPESLTVHELIIKYRYADAVPYWQTTEAYAVMEAWATSNDFQETIPLIEGADEWLRNVATIIPIAAYITMRPQSTLEGTRRWLDKHSFPPAPVIARPDEISWDDSHQWKATVVSSLYPTIVGLVDDRVAIAEAFASEYQGTIFLYGHSVSPRSDIDIVACATWEDVYTAVGDRYQ